LISTSQHGFVHGRSCFTNLLEFFDEETRKIDEGRVVIAVYMDFSKAFGKIPHGRLLWKFISHGIQGELENSIHNQPDGRKQRVMVQGCLSDWRLVISDFPQSSVLGPLLFTKEQRTKKNTAREQAIGPPSRSRSRDPA